uniref:EGF-like domain-containing protein n=1 Tax=Electrophorus electricus TaxID=8005 RepID=A0AAY5ELW1_ELEEL
MRGPPVGTPSTLSLRLLLLLSHFMDDSVSSQPICSRPPYHDWHPHPRNITLRWSLSEITCAIGNQDWHSIPEDEPLPRRWMCQSHAFPQLCPLEVQAEDGVFALYDRTLQRYGVNPVGMSEEAFDRCSLENERSLFAGGIDVSTQLHLKWLPPGVRYSAAAGGGSDQLCRLGLRVKVVVKQQLCQSFPTLRPCSGNGVCRAEAGRLLICVGSCRCVDAYSGVHWPRCEQDIDECTSSACKNGATCIDWPGNYFCQCANPFKGNNCSEIWGRGRGEKPSKTKAKLINLKKHFPHLSEPILLALPHCYVFKRGVGGTNIRK